MDARAEKYLHALGMRAEQLEGWAVQVAQRAGVDVGLVATKGPEIHIVSIAERKAMSRRNVLEFVKPLLEEHGYVTTRVPLEETDHKLRAHLGFVESWHDERWRYFVLTEMPFPKEGRWKPQP